MVRNSAGNIEYLGYSLLFCDAKIWSFEFIPPGAIKLFLVSNWLEERNNHRQPDKRPRLREYQTRDKFAQNSRAKITLLGADKGTGASNS